MADAQSESKESSKMAALTEEVFLATTMLSRLWKQHQPQPQLQQRQQQHIMGGFSFA